MLRVLTDEDGFDLKNRELMRVRTRNRWLLRTPNTDKPSAAEAPEADHVHVQVDDAQLALDLDLGHDEPAALLQQQPEAPEKSRNDLSAEVIAKRKGRLDRLEAQSVELWESRKRRRRTRGWAGLPADPPGPPRFPSETTIDESRAILSLSADFYREMRARFAQICEEEGVSKKTVAGPERWEAVKTRLIQELPHLQSVMWLDKERLDSKNLALDVICTDVTKRLRTMESSMTIADAKNMLNINPEESRTVRQEFMHILKGDHFTSKTEAGREHWEELKWAWTTNSVILQRILVGGAADPSYERKMRAMEVLARDVMKRFRDDQTKHDPNRKRSAPGAKPRPSPKSNQEPSSKPGNPSISVTETPDSHEAPDLGLDEDFDPQPPSLEQYHPVPTPIVSSTPERPRRNLNRGSSRLQSREHLRTADQHMESSQELQPTMPNNTVLSHSPSHDPAALLPSSVLSSGLPMDPQLSSALPVLISGHSPSMNTPHAHSPYVAQDLSADLSQGSAHSYVQTHFAARPARAPVAVYLRLHPSSLMTIAPAIWIATLTTRTFEELRQVAVKEITGAVCGRVEGILGEGMTIEISRDDELTAYLAVVERRNTDGTQGAPCFYVQILAAGWKT
jgi:hypothetical protein